MATFDSVLTRDSNGHHGVSVGDADGDGLDDLYVAQPAGLPNRLYRNRGDSTFEDITDPAGVGVLDDTAQSLFADVDNDGDEDLVLAIATGLLLFVNDGKGHFIPASDAFKFARPLQGVLTSITMADYDRDGFLDLYVCVYSYLFGAGEDKAGTPAPYYDARNGPPSVLFHNDGHGRFIDVTAEAGLGSGNDHYHFAAAWADYDNDGWPDVFINALSNQKYALYRNTKDAFEYMSGPSGVAGITLLRSGWGVKFMDFDNDGWKDLFVAQGHVMDNIELTQPSFRYLEPLLLMRNVKGKFQDVSKQSGPAFAVLRAGRGAAFGDLDNDGNVDIVINCNNQEAVVLRNQGETHNNWLLVNTVGTAGNRDGIGARIHLATDSGPDQYLLVSATGSYLSASDKRAHFGLGSNKVARLVEITWPNGTVQHLENVAANQILQVREPRSVPAGEKSKPQE